MTSSKPEDFTADFAALRDDVTKLTLSVSDFIRSHAASTKDTAVDAAGKAGQKISDTAGQAQHVMSGASADLEKTIERNPFVAVIVATLAGVLVGMIMGMLSPTRK